MTCGCATLPKFVDCILKEFDIGAEKLGTDENAEVDVGELGGGPETTGGLLAAVSA